MSEVKISQLPESTTVDNTVYIPIVQGTGTDTDNYKMKPSNAITKTDITTKLGAASASNDGYLSAAGWSLFNSKLDYRTFGTAANNNTGDFILNQNSSAQSANMWISGQVRVDNAIFSQINGSDTVGAGARFGLLNSAGNRFMLHQLNASNGEDIWSFDGTSYRNVYSLSYLGAATFASTVNAIQLQSTVATGTAPLTVNSTTMVGNLNAQYLNGRNDYLPLTGGVMVGTITMGGYNINSAYNITSTGTVTASQFVRTDGSIIYHSGNLTNNLSTNYIPKWNGSSFINAAIVVDNASFYTPLTMKIDNATQSTSPTTGALVVNGGMGVGGDLFLGNNTRDMLIRIGVPGVNWDIASNASHNLHIANGDGPLMTFDRTNQSVNIGYVSSQGYKLAVNGNGYFGGNVTASNFIGDLTGNASTATILQTTRTIWGQNFNGGGNVSGAITGATTGSFSGAVSTGALTVTGNILATGEVTAYSSSDERLKENIQPLNQSLELINKLNPVSYNWNDKAKELNSNKDDKTDVGVIAQELEKVLPNLVHNIYNDEFLAVDYVKLIPYLIGAIQELTQEINTLKNNK